MKKILIESCMKCPRYLSALYPSCQRIVTDVHAINPGCPLEDEPEQKPSRQDRAWDDLGNTLYEVGHAETPNEID